MNQDVTRGHGPLGPTYDEALLFASRIHHTQPRKGTDIAYLSHLMTVSALVLEDHGTEAQAIAGLLHDALEDGPAYAEGELEKRFGADVHAWVRACSDGLGGDRDKKPWAERKQAYVAHLSDAPVEALTITAADKLHNLRCTLDDLHEDHRAGRTPTWPKSNTCVHLNLWYYAAVLDRLQRRLPASRSVAGLERVLAEVCGLLGVARPAPTPDVPVCRECP